MHANPRGFLGEEVWGERESASVSIQNASTSPRFDERTVHHPSFEKNGVPPVLIQEDAERKKKSDTL